MTTLTRAALAFALLAASLPAQYLAVRTSAAGTPGGNYVYKVSLGDVDGNGLPEAFLQTGTALWMVPNVWNATPAQIAAPVYLAFCNAHSLANLNGDGFRDLLIAQGNLLFTMLGTGPGTFAPPVQVANLGLLGVISVSGGPPDLGGPLVAADFNGDGLDDAVVFGNPSSGVIINFGATWFIAWSGGPASLGGNYARVGDFNGDGFKDVVFSYGSPQTIQTWYGPYAAGPVTLPGPPGTSGGNLLAAGDVDGDGYDDAVVYAYPTAWGTGPIGVWVLYGGPAGLAYVPQSALIASGPVIFPFPPSACSIVDLDADGKKDIVGVEVTFNPASLAVARGLGGRMFSCRIDGQPWAAPSFNGNLPVFADLDADGDADALSFAYGFYGTAHQVLDNRATVATGCAGGAGVPAFPIGPAFWGNPAFTLGLSGAAPLAPAALIVSTQSSAAPGCGPGPSLLPESLVLPSGSLGVFTTTASGASSLTTPLPPVPALSGLRVFAQWAVADPAGAYPALGMSFALTATRTICVH